MAIDAVGTTTQTTTQNAPATPRPDGLGRDAFLELLVTQLQHQDPTSPQENGEFLAQLAQFSSLEQLTEIQKTLAAMSAVMGVETRVTDKQ